MGLDVSRLEHALIGATIHLVMLEWGKGPAIAPDLIAGARAVVEAGRFGSDLIAGLTRPEPPPMWEAGGVRTPAERMANLASAGDQLADVDGIIEWPTSETMGMRIAGACGAFLYIVSYATELADGEIRPTVSVIDELRQPAADLVRRWRALPALGAMVR
jgi:hypothetical protein